MKPTKHILATIALLLCSLTTSAHDFEVGGIYYDFTSEEDLTVEVTYRGDTYSSYNEYTGAVTIPEAVTYNSITYSVTSIGNYSFRRCSNLVSITIPASIKKIGSNVFENCNALTAVYISSIEAWCDIDFISNPLSYAHNLYLNGKLVTELVVPEGVTSIGSMAFYQCTSLTSITIPQSVTSIGKNAFRGCTGELIVNCNIPSASSSSYGAFYGSGFTKVTIGEEVTSIGEHALSGCSYLVSIVVAEGNTKFDSRDGCNAIINTRTKQLIAGCSTTTIPEGVTKIGDKAFYGCDGLTSIAIPESVMQIGEEAFYDCDGLTNITIPGSVTEIRDFAFYGCDKLSTIYILDGVKQIGEEAFYDCNGLTSIIIPTSITSIGRKAFYGCTGELVVNCNPPSTSSSWGAFYGGKFTKVTIGDNVTSIGTGAFNNCRGLTSITIPRNVTKIGEYAFQYCTNLVTLVLYEGVEYIYSHAFEGCSSLTTITLPENSKLTSIGGAAFQDCSSLTSITLPESVTSIAGSAFYGCSSLTSIVLPKNLKNIYSKAFANCAELLDVYCYAESVPSASSDAFTDSYPEYVTLHVPASALNAYKTTAPWSSFGTMTGIIAVSGITLNYTTVELAVGETLRLIATVTPDDAFDKTVTWSSSNAAVASVDENGNVTVLKYGRTVTITATAGDCMAKCTIKINKAIEVGGVALNQTTANLSVGDTLTLVATVTPDNATNKTITWATSNNSVVAVNSNGKITAVAEGTATITAKVGDKEAVCIVTVSIPDSIEQLSIGKSKLVIYDLHGRRVENPGKGIYIMGGKKVVVK